MSTVRRASIEMVSVGVIGLGNMGLPMTRNLLAAHRVRVTGRSRSRAAEALAAGAVWSETPLELAQTTDVVIVMVPDLPQVDELLFGPVGLAAAPTDLVIVVSSTVSPTGLRELDHRLREKTGNRMRLVDAPVSGGAEGAAAGTLSIMVGGAEADVARVLPVLAACGTPVHLGPLGAGEVAKACNQLIVAATMAAIAEASVIAERSGLDLDALLTVLGGGYAGSRVLESKHRMLVEKEYPLGGRASYMVKDLSFAAAAAETTRTSTPQLDLLRVLFDRLVASGLGDEDLAVVQRFVALESERPGAPR